MLQRPRQTNLFDLRTPNTNIAVFENLAANSDKKGTKMTTVNLLTSNDISFV